MSQPPGSTSSGWHQSFRGARWSVGPVNSTRVIQGGEFTQQALNLLGFYIFPHCLWKESWSLRAVWWIPTTYDWSARSLVITLLLMTLHYITPAPSVVMSTSVFLQPVMTPLSITSHTTSAEACGLWNSFYPNKISFDLTLTGTPDIDHLFLNHCTV